MCSTEEAVDEKANEDRMPYLRSLDVLIQYMVTLAVSDGFRSGELLAEVRGTTSFASVSDEEWNWCLDSLFVAARALRATTTFKGRCRRGRVQSHFAKVSMRHKFNIGTIVSSTMVKVKLQKGKFLGQVEEYFISKLIPGDAFWFAGRCLELVRFKGVEATVRLSKQKKGQVPSYMGGRMPLSAELGYFLRRSWRNRPRDSFEDPELALVQPIISLQKERSAVPTRDQFLIEYLEDKEGHHLFVYPFEGRLVHEGLASLLSYRSVISGSRPLALL